MPGTRWQLSLAKCRTRVSRRVVDGSGVPCQFCFRPACPACPRSVSLFSGRPYGRRTLKAWPVLFSLFSRRRGHGAALRLFEVATGAADHAAALLRRPRGGRGREDDGESRTVPRSFRVPGPSRPDTALPAGRSRNVARPPRERRAGRGVRGFLRVSSSAPGAAPASVRRADTPHSPVSGGGRARAALRHG